MKSAQYVYLGKEPWLSIPKGPSVDAFSLDSKMTDRYGTAVLLLVISSLWCFYVTFETDIWSWHICKARGDKDTWDLSLNSWKHQTVDFTSSFLAIFHETELSLLYLINLASEGRALVQTSVLLISKNFWPIWGLWIDLSSVLSEISSFGMLAPYGGKLSMKPYSGAQYVSFENRTIITFSEIPLSASYV